MDFGFRLASSGWDRLSLLLDLTFALNTKDRCSLRVILKELPIRDKNIVKNGHFISLKTFRDNKFLELEAGQGEGTRHEATHLLSPRTRFFAEFIDTTLQGRPIAEERRKEQLDKLGEHHWHYLRGIHDALRLVAYRWPQKTP